MGVRSRLAWVTLYLAPPNTGGGGDKTFRGLGGGELTPPPTRGHRGSSFLQNPWDHLVYIVFIIHVFHPDPAAPISVLLTRVDFVRTRVHPLASHCVWFCHCPAPDQLVRTFGVCSPSITPDRLQRGPGPVPGEPAGAAARAFPNPEGTPDPVPQIAGSQSALFARPETTPTSLGKKGARGLGLSGLSSQQPFWRPEAGRPPPRRC